MNWNSVFKLLSFIILFVAAIMLIPLFIALGYGEERALKAFIYTLLIMVISSSILLLIVGRKKERLSIGPKESYLFVTLTWILMSFFGALPLYFASTFTSFSDCYFEIMSGFTTTGATALDNIEIVEKSILFWRNMTNWLGGMGIVVLFVAVLPAFGAKGTALIGAESVGPTKDKLTPQIRYTAMALWLIYIGLTILQTILLLLGGLDLFSALTVTFGTMGAAGFTPTNLSILSYNSPYVEWVCTIFMFLAGTNFALYFKLLKGDIKKVVKDGEFRLYFSIVLISSLLISINLFLSAGLSISKSIRDSFFQVVSIITTTGFTSTNYSLWPGFSQMILFVLSFVGGCAGSAGGGIKVIRIYAIFKLGKESILKRLHPKAITTTKIGEDKYSKEVLSSISGFIGLYLITFALGTIVVSLSGQDILTCISATITTIGNIGVGIGGIGTSFSFSVFPDWTQWVFSFLMMVGRLEIFTVYALFTREFWLN